MAFRYARSSSCPSYVAADVALEARLVAEAGDLGDAVELGVQLPEVRADVVVGPVVGQRQRARRTRRRRRRSSGARPGRRCRAAAWARGSGRGRCARPRRRRTAPGPCPRAGRRRDGRRDRACRPSAARRPRPRPRGSARWPRAPGRCGPTGAPCRRRRCASRWRPAGWGRPRGGRRCGAPRPRGRASAAPARRPRRHGRGGCGSAGRRAGARRPARRRPARPTTPGPGRPGTRRSGGRRRVLGALEVRVDLAVDGHGRRPITMSWNEEPSSSPRQVPGCTVATSRPWRRCASVTQVLS